MNNSSADKPEVKKAGGVYYTPSYIVDYIVKNTVGKLCEGKTPRQIANLRILDPACGSGSFLLGAYQYLLDYHRDWYLSNDPQKHSKKIYQGRAAQWFLTIAEKKRILLNNIFGVDIDFQAVEVTKLSLLLKVLEGESAETIGQVYKMFHERALPDLADNIKCGNSLIAPDFFDDASICHSREGGNPDELRKKINAFDWQTEFPEIFSRKNPGFDAVIGNPPYIPIETMSDSEKDYFKRTHPELQRKYDSSIVFILAMLRKLRPTAYLGFISSLTWQTGQNFRKLRQHLFTNAGVHTLVNLPFDVFKNAYVDTGIYILSGSPTPTYQIYRFPKKAKCHAIENIAYSKVPVPMVTSPEYKLVLNPQAQAMLIQFHSQNQFTKLGDLTISTQGLAANKFTLLPTPPNDKWYPFLSKGQVYRYHLAVDNIQYTDITSYPTLAKFYYESPKLLIRRVINRQDRLMATYTNNRLVFKKDINPFVFTSLSPDPLYILAMLNSTLLSYFYVNTSSIATKDDFRQTTLAELRALPIRTIDFDNSDDKTMHDKTVKLVERMLDLNKKLPDAKAPPEKTRIQRDIENTDNQIDQLVYKLYNLTPKEIKIIEDATK